MDLQLYSAAVDLIAAKSSGDSHPCLHSITINFHPEYLTASGVPLLVAIAQDGRIKTQFETGTSNGGLGAFEGGKRWCWEQSIFDGIYDNAAPCQRPIYGALNTRQLLVGAAPRFGSACFRLNSHVVNRATFCYPDSHMAPTHFATAEYLAPLIDLAVDFSGDPLDAYIEAQVHGGVSVEDDIDALVLDPIYKGTSIDSQASRLGVKVEWHAGYELDVAVVEQHADYRGDSAVEIAREIAVEGKLNPRLLNSAINNGGCTAQEVKKVWHYLARFC